MHLLKRAFYYLDKEPYKRTNSGTLTVLAMASIMVLFLPLIVTLLLARTRLHNLPFLVPHAFSLSTLIIILSSRLLHYTRLYKDQDQYKKFRTSLIGVVMLGVLFLYTQYLGWNVVHNAIHLYHIKIIIVIVALHGLHFLIAMLLFLVHFARYSKVASPADSYIYFLNPQKNNAFRSACLYWDYLGYLWIGLYLLMVVKTL